MDADLPVTKRPITGLILKLSNTLKSLSSR